MVTRLEGRSAGAAVCFGGLEVGFVDNKRLAERDANDNWRTVDGIIFLIFLQQI